MNILVLSQYFSPEKFRINDIVEELGKKKKLNIDVLTSKPSYPTKYQFKKKNYKKFGRIKIYRASVFLRNGSLISVYLNYITFVISTSYYLMFKLSKKYDKIFIFQVSPVFTAIPAIIYSKFFKCKTYMWVLDLWPDSIKVFGFRSKILFYIIKKISDYIYLNIDNLLAQSKSISKILEKRYKKKTYYFPNWSEEVLSKKPTVNLINKVENQTNKFQYNIFFGGNLGKAQDIENILNTINLSGTKTNRLNWFIFGEGSEKIKIINFIKNNSIKDIKLFDTIPQENFFYLVKKYADFLLVSLGKDQTLKWTVPGKIQFYFQCKKPIVGMISGEGKSLIKKSNSGYVVDSGDYKKLSKFLTDLPQIKKNKNLIRKGLNGFKFSEKNFKKKNIISSLYKILKI